MDSGVGIHEHLRKKEKYRSISAKQSLGLAIQNQVSGHPTNSPGFGLYSASRFTSYKDGSLAIWSSGRKLISENGNLKIKRGGFTSGTLICFQVYKDINIPFDEIVSDRTSDNYEWLFDNMKE